MKILFMGRKRVAADCLQHLCALPGVKVVGVLTDSHLNVSVTSEVARANNLPILDHAKTSERLERGELSYDLGLSVLYWRRLRGAFLRVPGLKNINFHPAPLPEYKGTAGYNLAILEGLREWGVTAHYMDDSIDTGGIIKVAAFPINPESETVATLERLSAERMAALFREIIAQVLAAGTVLPSSPNIGGRYISRQQMEDMKEIREGDDVARKIRAFWYPPYDGAWLRVNGGKYTLVSREILLKLGDSAASTLFTQPAKRGVR